jgi:hypothetical protein
VGDLSEMYESLHRTVAQLRQTAERDLTLIEELMREQALELVGLIEGSSDPDSMWLAWSIREIAEQCEVGSAALQQAAEILEAYIYSTDQERLRTGLSHFLDPSLAEELNHGGASVSALSGDGAKDSWKAKVRRTSQESIQVEIRKGAQNIALVVVQGGTVEGRCSAIPNLSNCGYSADESEGLCKETYQAYGPDTSLPPTLWEKVKERTTHFVLGQLGPLAAGAAGASIGSAIDLSPIALAGMTGVVGFVANHAVHQLKGAASEGNLKQATTSVIEMASNPRLTLPFSDSARLRVDYPDCGPEEKEVLASIRQTCAIAGYTHDETNAIKSKLKESMKEIGEANDAASRRGAVQLLVKCRFPVTRKEVAAEFHRTLFPVVRESSSA